MSDLNEWTSQERRIAAELSRMPVHGTPDCLEPEQMLDLIEASEGMPIAADKMAHIALCPVCRQSYFELQNAWRETADLRRKNSPHATAPESASPELLMSVPNALVGSPQRGSLGRLRYRLFAPVVSFALGAAAVWLLLVHSPIAKPPPTVSPTDKQVSVLQSAVEARDLRIAQLEQEQHANQQQARSAQGRIEKHDKELQKLLDIARLDREDYRQSAHLLANSSSDLPETKRNMVIRGTGSSETTLHAIELLTPPMFAVRGGAPTLKCRPLSGASDYHLSIDDTTERSEVPLTALTPTEWRIKTPLRPNATKDRVYRWSIQATRNGKEVSSQTGQFVVLSQTTQRLLDQKVRKYAHLPLTLGILYRQAGLLQDAEREFKECRKDPEKRALAEALLKQLRADAGDTADYLQSPIRQKGAQK